MSMTKNPTTELMRPAPRHRQRSMPIHSAVACRVSACWSPSSLLVAACGGAVKTTAQPLPQTTSAPPTSARPTTWSLPGAHLQNTRDVGGPINASNVSTLGVAWTDPITAPRHSAATRRRRSCPAA